jgi:hypothetical protein
VAAVNAALDEFRPDPGVLLLEISALHGRPECWAVDRIHPSGFGHRVLAGQAADRLGLPFQVGPAPVAPSVTAFWRWVGRHGVPWLAARTPELVTSEPLRRATRRIAYGTGV